MYRDKTKTYNGYRWYSFCSAHREYKKECTQCNAGTWENIIDIGNV